MTAKEMFGKLGYSRRKNKANLIYAKIIYDEKFKVNYTQILNFCLTDNQMFYYHSCENPNVPKRSGLNQDELRAISKQCKELGWLEEDV